jgi:hypothetical protein
VLQVKPQQSKFCISDAKAAKYIRYYQDRRRAFWVGVQVGRGGYYALPLGVRGSAPETKSKLFLFKCHFKLVVQLILDTERGYIRLLIFGYMRNFKRLLVSLIKLVMLEASESPLH